MRIGFTLCLNSGRPPVAAVAGYRYFKLHITSTTDGTGTSVAEFEAATASGGSNQFLSKSITATSSFDGTTPATNAVDGSIATFWASDFVSLPQDLVVDMGVGNAIVPFEFRVTVRSGSSSQYPGNFTIAGSNDGSSYTTLITRVGETFTDNQTKTFTA